MAQTLSEEKINSIRGRLSEYCNKNPQTSNRIIANNIGYSPSYISLFRNNKFPTEQTIIAEKIENFLNNEDLSVTEAVKNGHLNFVMTTAAQDIFRVANYVLTENVFGVVVGVPGCGKTISVKEFQKRNPTAIVLEVTPLVSQKSLVQDICQELKIPIFIFRSERGTHITINSLFNSIVNQLKGTRRLLIIDEGENLNVKCLEIIRRIQDFTGTGILLSGTERLLDRLRGPRCELQQLYSRVGIQKEINLLLLADIKAILTANFPEALPFANTFLQLSKNNGRLLEHLISLVKKTIRETGEALSDDLIDDAVSSLLF